MKRVIKIIELIQKMPIGILAMLFICPIEIPVFIKESFKNWHEEFKSV